MKSINLQSSNLPIIILTLIISGIFSFTKAQVTSDQDPYHLVRKSFLKQEEYKISTKPDLKEYTQILLKNNPAIKSAFAGWKAALKRIAVAKGLPDPRISFGYFIENIETAVGPQEYKLGIRQPIPWLGKLIVQSDIQSLQAKASFHQLQTVINKKLLQLQKVYYKNYYLERAVTITSRNIKLVENWEKVILNRYKSNLSRHADLMKTQMKLLKLQDDIETLKNKKETFLATFHWLLNVQLNKIETPDSLTFKPVSDSKEKFIQLILNNNPQLKKYELSNQIMNREIKLKKLNLLPDFSIGVDYIFTGNKFKTAGQPVPESGKDPLVIMGSMSIPLWFFKQSSEIQSAKLNKLKSDFIYQDQKNNLRNQLETIWFRIRETSRKYKLYKDKLLPKAWESLQASEKAYISDDSEFLNIIDSQKMYLMYQLSAEKALTDYYIAVADLEFIMGGTLWEK
ncbi:MAG: TolC family protein [bacterium]